MVKSSVILHICPQLQRWSIWPINFILTIKIISQIFKLKHQNHPRIESAFHSVLSTFTQNPECFFSVSDVLLQCSSPEGSFGLEHSTVVRLFYPSVSSLVLRFPFFFWNAQLTALMIMQASTCQARGHWPDVWSLLHHWELRHPHFTINISLI